MREYELLYLRMPETSFNNRLAQRPKGKQKHFIIESLDSSVFVSQTHNVEHSLRFNDRKGRRIVTSIQKG